VVDAGVAGEEGKTVGDLAPEVYDRADLTLTPVKGGVAPLPSAPYSKTSSAPRACVRPKFVKLA